jgi:hypothetical protein
MVTKRKKPMVTKRQFDQHYFDGFKQQEMRGGQEWTEWQKDSAVVTDWMNAAKDSESCARVAKLVDQICQVEIDRNRSLREVQLRDREKSKTDAVRVQTREEFGSAGSIDKTLLRYSYSPGLHYQATVRTWYLSMYSASVPAEFVLKREFNPSPMGISAKKLQNYYHDEHTVGEGDIVLRILNLAAASELERVRQCETCLKWFYAERSHQKFCPGGACRLAKYSKTPKYRNYRKLYMRRQRAKQAVEQSEKPPRGNGK